MSEMSEFESGERVEVGFWKDGSPGSVFINYGGGDPAHHTVGLYWRRGTIVNGDYQWPQAQTGPHLLNAHIFVMLDRHKWYRLFKEKIYVRRYRIRKMCPLEQLAET
jgi:hypothetical protein